MIGMALIGKTVLSGLGKYWKHILAAILIGLVAFYIYLDYVHKGEMQAQITEVVGKNALLTTQVQSLAQANTQLYSDYVELTEEIFATQQIALSTEAKTSSIRTSLSQTNKDLDKMKRRDKVLLGKPKWTAKLITRSQQKHLDELACVTGNKSKCLNKSDQ